MTIFNFSRLAHASAPLFARFLARNSTRNFWPLSPLALAAMLEQLELPQRRSTLKLSGIQPGCSVLLCDETQQCQWFTLVNDLSDHNSDTEIALLSPLGMALIGKNVGAEVRLFTGMPCKFTIAEIVRVKRQPGNP
ncbi:hypothetical protein EOE67_19765 [Rheinheimera riviphila]|uniref:Transcription elongation factor GreA/GreB C-terminal domain-containing protein n=1 Tax=Rheinheimera riviphila TaxID=1834037 RepID=A0A437QBX9_9GAMM|nr:GreA/GreB family elongation factor [Rheinheimera riviphila]RVU31873.1 hypothetical protein EOE67_19765 [Rheinheimera riviphila]